MKRNTCLGIAAVVAFTSLALTGCGGEQKAAEAPTMPSAEPPTDQAPELDAGAPEPSTSEEAKSGSKPEPKPEALSDAQIATITEAANSAEIAQAQVAQ